MIGLVVYMLVARPSGLLSGVLATVPASVVLVVVAYHANLLDTVDPTTPAAVSQGHRVALAAGICAAVCAGLRVIFAVGLDPRLRRIAGRALIESPDEARRDRGRRRGDRGGRPRARRPPQPRARLAAVPQRRNSPAAARATCANA